MSVRRESSGKTRPCARGESSEAQIGGARGGGDDKGGEDQSKQKNTTRGSVKSDQLSGGGGGERVIKKVGVHTEPRRGAGGKKHGFLLGR